MPNHVSRKLRKPRALRLEDSLLDVTLGSYDWVWLKTPAIAVFVSDNDVDQLIAWLSKTSAYLKAKKGSRK